MKTKNRLFAMLIALILMVGLFPVQAKAEKTKLIVTAIDQTYTYNGWIQGEGDTIYAVPAQIAQKVRVEGLNEGDYIYLVELFGQGTNAGEYEVAVNKCVVRNSATNDNVTENYDIELVAGKMTIEPATLTVTTGSASKVYDGTPLEKETVTIEGFIRNDTATVKATGSRTDAGTSDNTCEIEWGETKASNYKIDEKLGTLTVTPAEASITVDSASKMQGKADPDFTGSVEGLVAEGDLGEVEYIRIGTDEAPGDYAGVLDAVYKANPNYNVTVTKGNFTITPVTITGIKLNSDNAKKVYNEGDALDVTGLTLEVSKSDGSKSTVDVTAAMISGFDSSKTGTQTLTVSYEGFTAQYEVTVSEITVTGITLDGKNAKTEYTEGDALDVSGLTLTAKYSDGSEKKVDVTASMVSGFDSGKIGKQTVTVTYENCTATYEIEVKAKAAISYTAKDGSGNTIQSVTWQKGSGKNLDLTFHRSADDHLTYGLFGSLEIGGVTVGSANYSAAEGSLKLSIKPEYLETLSVGDHTVKVNFQDGSAMVKLTVKAAADPNVPRTADESNPTLWSGLMLLSAAMLVLLPIARKRKTER